jgi:hypothetical protein
VPRTKKVLRQLPCRQMSNFRSSPKKFRLVWKNFISGWDDMTRLQKKSGKANILSFLTSLGLDTDVPNIYSEKAFPVRIFGNFSLKLFGTAVFLKIFFTVLHSKIKRYHYFYNIELLKDVMIMKFSENREC